MSRLTETEPTLRCPTSPSHTKFVRFKSQSPIQVVDEQGHPLSNPTQRYFCTECGQAATELKILLG